MRQRTCRSQPRIEGRRLSFYAAIFDEPAKVYDFRPGAKERSDYTEVVRPGSFTDTLNTGANVIATVDHDATRTFAERADSSLLIQQDGFGLFASTWLPDTELGDEVAASVRAGKLEGASFRFTSTREIWTDDVCELLAVDLADVCVTAKPAYKATVGEVHLRQSNRLKELFARLALTKFKIRNLDKSLGPKEKK